MPSQDEIRMMVNKVTSFSVEEKEAIYRKNFSVPNSTVKFLCKYYDFHKKRILDVACCYGYYLVRFGKDSVGIDGTPRYLQFAQEMGLSVQGANIEEPLPKFEEKFDGLLFSGTLEEILSPHLMLMRFRELLKPDGLLCLRVPSVPPVWFDKLIRLRMSPGYDAQAHLYFFTPRLIKLIVERAGYDVLQVASTGIVMTNWLRPFHKLLLPLTPVVTVMARPKPGFKYPPIRAMRFLPDWANELAPYHEQ